MLAERIGCRPRDPETKPTEEGEQGNHHANTRKPPFLTDGAEEEVRVRVREISELLLAFSKADPEQLARTDPDQRLIDLKTGFRGGVAGIQEGQHAGETILHVADLMEHQNHPDAGDQAEVAD